MQQTGRKTCAEIGLSKNFAQMENKPEIFGSPNDCQNDGEKRVPRADQILQSGKSVDDTF